MSQNSSVIALDVGEKRIGVAFAGDDVRIAVPLQTIDVDGTELDQLAKIVDDKKAEAVVIGYPRNQSGDATAQSAYVETFARQLSSVVSVRQIFQDESLTSIQAEDRLKMSGHPYVKDDVDAHAAAIILQDYLESSHEE